VTLPVLIAGAGIAGLSAAIALAQRGIASIVLERQAELAEAGAGIQLGPNAVKVLRRLGVAAELEPFVQLPDAVDVWSARHGRRIVRLPLGAWMEQRHGAPYWTVRRADLQRAVLAVAATHAEVDLRLGAAVVQVQEAGATVIATTEQGAADGLWSQVRPMIAPGAVPKPAGRVAWRARLPRRGLPEAFADNAVGLWLGADGHLVHYPVGAGDTVNVVAISREQTAAAVGWSRPVAAAEVEQRFSAWPAPVRVAMAAGADWRCWSLYEHDARAAWTRGSILALGDAAHPVLPFLAQGAGLALEDAEAVAYHLEAGLPAASASATSSALAAFVRERQARALRVAAASRRNGGLYHVAGPAAWVRDQGMAAAGGERLMRGYDWLYGYERASSGSS
jgi:salicylate hydroxylase